jgi:hypothetical protein
MKKYEKKLNKAYVDYERKIIKIAELAQKEKIIPYLKKNNYHMLVGNGTYYIFDPNNKSEYIHYDLPKLILRVLELKVDTIHAMDLGCWMSDYIGDN